MNDNFLRACRGEEVSHTPVWLMRQAGRYLPEYQAVRGKVDFLTLCKTPELAAEVTFQPVDILGVDAAILFSDILVVNEAMGQGLEFHEKRGPILPDPVRSMADVNRLIVPEAEDKLGYVMETIKILRKGLKVPLIGFSGAPFTLATYAVEGGSSKNFINTKTMMYSAPEVYEAMMDKITSAVEGYLAAQIRAGAQAVQIFDSWVGVLDPRDFRQYELPYVKRIVKNIKSQFPDIPVIYFVNNCAALLKDAADAGSDVLGIDWRIDMGDAVKMVGKDFAIQGNFDPIALFSPHEKIRERVKDILDKGRGAKGHIFNLGHGIVPETPVEAAKTMVNAVHEFSKK